ncbi:hypothetical protein FQR65_LT12975 [Abscondita terminalis]|nr:hypothetical protein FQR65_LT12975 [Abscondita terminalis]
MTIMDHQHRHPPQYNGMANAKQGWSLDYVTFQITPQIITSKILYPPLHMELPCLRRSPVTFVKITI